jgi:response regulator RpfG family c-di-GMP phosphodiesterase
LGYHVLVISCSSPSTGTNVGVVGLLATLSLGLLLEVVLNTTLAGLALSTKLVVVSLLFLVAGEVRDGTTKSTLDTVADASAEIAELTLGLLVSTLEILLMASLLQGLSIMLVK